MHHVQYRAWQRALLVEGSRPFACGPIRPVPHGPHFRAAPMRPAAYGVATADRGQKELEEDTRVDATPPTPKREKAQPAQRVQVEPAGRSFACPQRTSTAMSWAPDLRRRFQLLRPSSFAILLDL